MKLWPPKPGCTVKLVQPWLAVLERRLGIDGEADVEAEVPHLCDQTGGAAYLDVDGAAVRTRVAEGLQELPWVVHHQVAIEVEVGVTADPGHHGRPDGQVGHEMAVHHINVQYVSLRPDPADLVAQLGEVCRQDRWRNADGVPGLVGRARGSLLCHRRRT
jgi:hypothetical protein